LNHKIKSGARAQAGKILIRKIQALFFVTLQNRPKKDDGTVEKAKKGLLSQAEELKKQGTEAVKKAEGVFSNTLKTFGK